MIADVFTKAADKGTFYEMWDQMMNMNFSVREALRAGVYGSIGKGALALAKIMK